MTDKVYIYQHDKYGNNGDFACTYQQFIAMIDECFPDFEGEFEEFSGQITDQDNEVICREATPELIEEYYDGDISEVIDPDNLIGEYLKSL